MNFQFANYICTFEIFLKAETASSLGTPNAPVIITNSSPLIDPSSEIGQESIYLLILDLIHPLE